MKNLNFLPQLLTFLLLTGLSIPRATVFEEIDGLVAVEAEHYVSTEKETERKWYLTSGTVVPDIEPDPDPSHAGDASGGSYMEILPDTRVTHDDPLVNGVSFSNSGGTLTIISYDVYFNTTGTYKVWVRAYSAGSEDNGVHVGIDGTWPATGERIQWCSGKNQWTWSGAQRTDAVHCGVPGLIEIEVPSVGQHTISFSQREDGFEMDKWIMTLDEDYTPEGAGPDEVVYSDTVTALVPGLKSENPSHSLMVTRNGLAGQLQRLIDTGIRHSVRIYNLNGDVIARADNLETLVTSAKKMQYGSGSNLLVMQVNRQ